VFSQQSLASESKMNWLTIFSKKVLKFMLKLVTILSLSRRITRLYSDPKSKSMPKVQVGGSVMKNSNITNFTK